MGESPQSTKPVSPSRSRASEAASSLSRFLDIEANGEGCDDWESSSPPLSEATFFPSQNRSTNSDDGRYLSGWVPCASSQWAVSSSIEAETTDSDESTDSNDGSFVVASSPGEVLSQFTDNAEPCISGSNSHRSSLSDLLENDPNKDDGIPPKKESRGYRLSEKYLEYRAQMQQDTGKDGGSIWLDEVEDALHRALERYVPGIWHQRDELIAGYIYDTTIQRVTATQVSAYLRSLDSILKGDPEWDSLMREPPADRPNKDITDSHKSSTIDDDDSWVPVDGLGRLCSNMVKSFNFEMMVMAPHRRSRINGIHTITRTPRYRNHRLQSLTSFNYFKRWRPFFPYLKSALESSKNFLTPEVLLIESDLALTNILSPSISNSNIELKLDLNFPVAGESLTCRTIFCQNGHKIFETKYSLPQQLSTEVQLPFESTWWAKYIAGVTGRNQRLYLSGAPHTLGEVIIDNLSAVQEIWATSDSHRYTSNSSVDDAPSNYEYTEDPVEAIEKVITLTGSTESVQALTCGEYMRETWPSTGKDVLELLKVLVSGETQGSTILPGDTRLCFSRHPSKIQSTSFNIWVDARGNAAVIAEIGEQLAWLASALRSSQSQGRIAYSTPFIGGMQVRHVSYEGMLKIAYTCEIGVEVREGIIGTASANGECWLNLFAMPLVVEGFSIRRRPEQHFEGLEIPLTMMVTLAGARMVNSFEEKTVLKGFSTMLIPTKCSLDTVTWHLVYDKDDNRIPYFETERFTKHDITFQQLEASRHIVGWCPDILFYAGESDASYDIKNSGLLRPSEPSSILKSASLSAGHTVTGGVAFNMGRRDIRMRRNPYIKKIKWISQRYVTFWDIGDKRGWLVNGASALLHLVRASIAQDQHDSRFSSLCLFNDREFQEASRAYQPDSALEVLLNPTNFKVIVPEDDGHICFKDRVEDFYEVLERMIDYQTKAIGVNGKACQQPRSFLDGWNFTDIVMERDPIYPRQTILNYDGLSWVDLTRTIHAVTLFGRGFDEVIRPMHTYCPLWATLPHGMSYLVASVADLNAVMEAYGDPYSTPTRLTHEIVYYCADEALSQCLCQGDADEHLDITQVLLPSDMRHELSSKSSMCLKGNGAVVFGHNSRNTWFWGDAGHPSRASNKDKRSLLPMESNESTSDDSGIGRSFHSSTSGQTDDVWTPELIQSVEEYHNYEEAQGTENSRHASENRVSSKSKPLSARDFQVAIVCALATELMAVRSLFDKTYEKLPIADADPNYYALGFMAGHNIVAVCLPRGTHGTNPAANVASNMRRSFPALQSCLLVGIGAGVPSRENDIRLGDIVVSTPSGKYSGVLPYDMLKTLERGVSQLNGYLCPPPENLRGAINELESDPTHSPIPLTAHLHQIVQLKPQYMCPGASHDRLFMSHYSHASSHNNCDQCNPAYEIQRPPRLSTHPEIHYGLIASGNQLMRSAETRDRLSKEHNVLCFEMEGAGIMNSFPCLVIRGICDYADSHKNKQWQNYAAAAAAAYAKLLLSRVRTLVVDSVVEVRGSESPCYHSRKRPPSPGATSAQDQRPAKRTDWFGHFKDG